MADGYIRSGTHKLKVRLTETFCYSYMCKNKKISKYQIKADLFAIVCVDCPLNDSYGSQLLSNGEEKLAERMVKDLEPRKSIGGLKKTGMND